MGRRVRVLDSNSAVLEQKVMRLVGSARGAPLWMWSQFKLGKNRTKPNFLVSLGPKILKQGLLLQRLETTGHSFVVSLLHLETRSRQDFSTAFTEEQLPSNGDNATRFLHTRQAVECRFVSGVDIASNRLL